MYLISLGCNFSHFSISVLQPRDIRYLSNLFSIKCHETMMNQSTNQSIVSHTTSKLKFS